MFNLEKIRDRLLVKTSHEVHNTYRERRNWFRLILKLKASVIPAILPRVILCFSFALLISWLYSLGIEKVSLDTLNGLVPTIVLGLLLVFRTNTAYDRFWEGRKLWERLVSTSRNLARFIWVTIPDNKPNHRKEKVKALKLIAAFSVATKLHLRSEDVNQELVELVPPEYLTELKAVNHRPLKIAFWLADYFQKEYDEGRLIILQMVSLTKLLDIMVDCLGGCERILKTPLPLTYSIHLRQLALLYCLSLPFQVVNELLWLTPFFVSFVSFAVFGIEEIGIEIENPFGHDHNDLALDQICSTMKINIRDLMNLDPQNV
ncbi:MAG: hypothetical protein EA365_00915 [Gloeocapsa sp. DLM2.Bin57]|nr:MAG: hypothetical protein EA365_00915 [Gloeocapsa sp. DLM2.Bin57]